MIGALLRWLSAGRVRRPSSSSFGGRAPHASRPSAGRVRRSSSSGFGGRAPHVPAMPRWLSAGRVRRPLSSGVGTCPPCPAPVVIQCGGGRARMRPASAVFRFRDHARHARACLLDVCGVRPFRCGDAPACARRLLSSGFGIMPAMPAPVCWTCAASVPSGVGTCPPCPAPASRRQGTSGPGDALMVGIPAARLCF